MDDVAGKKRPRPESQDDESRDETEGVVWHDYVCPKGFVNQCAGCKPKGPAGNRTKTGPCLRQVRAKIEISDALANRALEGVALPDAASLCDLAAAPLTDWGIGQPEAGALVVTIKPPGIGVVVEVVSSGHRKVKVVGRADIVSRVRKLLRPFVVTRQTASVEDDTPPLITATLVRPNVVFQRYVPRCRSLRDRIAHAESVASCTSKYSLWRSPTNDGAKDFIRSLASGLSTIRELPATFLELTTAANVATKREHCLPSSGAHLLWLVNMGQKMNLWDVTLASGAQSRSTKLSAGDLRFAPGSGEAPTDEPGNVCPISMNRLPTWVNSVSFSGELGRPPKGLMATVNMQRCPCGHHRTALWAFQTKARNTKALVLKGAYAKALEHADAGHHGSGAELLRAAISALER